MIEKGETSATNPGAESGSITGKDRGPLQLRLPATERIAFDHKFEPANKVPPESR